jgi:alpha-tubulin suppressor-like RCC1 family protein
MKIHKIILEILGFCLAASIFCGSIYGQSVVKIGAGGWCSFVIKSNGSLWGMGGNTFGELGDGTTMNRSYPVQVVPSGVVAISPHEPNLFLKSDGSLWGMGYNGYGALGDGTTADAISPELIESNGVIAVGGGYLDSFFIKSNTSLWGMGYSDYGLLGDGTHTDDDNFTNRPEQIVSKDVVAVAGAFSHSLFLKSDGSLWGMGDNQYDELTDDEAMEFDSPVLLVSSNVVAVAAADWFTLFIKTDGSLWGMGYNGQGQLGDGTTDNCYDPVEIVSNGVIAVVAGDEEYGHSLFVKSDGSLWGMGENQYGVLGDGSTTDRHSPVKIVSSGVVAVATGARHSLFLKSDGSVWGMGDNSYGQLGDGTLDERDTPVLIIPPPPALLGLSFSGANLIFHGTNGLAGGAYSVLTSTNVALPLIQWTSISTNLLNTNGSFTITATNALNPPAARQFYTLRLNQ